MPQTKLAWRAKEPGRKLKLTGWVLSDAETATEVELSWTKSFGGPIAGTAAADTPADVHHENPLGPGLLDVRHGDPETPVQAHQLDDPDDPVTDWRRHDARPQGFGLVSPWWRQRQQYAGTYDEAWLEKRHPLPPEDFDPRFWQCAHPDLIASPYLRGDEAYELSNLHWDADLARQLAGDHARRPLRRRGRCEHRLARYGA